MPNLSLTLACWDYDRTRPLFDGRVKAEGIDLDFKVMRPRQIFPRMLERQEFDISELSFASFAMLKARGECPFVGLPIALSKIFRHSCIYVRPGAASPSRPISGASGSGFRNMPRAPSSTCAA
jgi:4,5-dihydroxyphthalate decarboxylase